jgi:hypothetical protein
MDREYVNEQVREGLTETVLYVRAQDPMSPQPALVPIDDLWTGLTAIHEESVRRLNLDPARFTLAVQSELANSIYAQLQMSPRRDELSLIALNKEAQDLSENAVTASRDALRISTSLGKLKNSTYEDYFELRKTAKDPVLMESILTTPPRARFTSVARGGQPIEPVKLPFTSLPSSQLHRITATVGAVDDFRDTAALKILSTQRARSRVLETLSGQRVPLSFSRKQTEERRMLLTAQYSGSDIALHVTARIGIGLANSKQNQLVLRNVLPLAEQSARFRTAHDSAQAMFKQLSLLDTEDSESQSRR